MPVSRVVETFRLSSVPDAEVLLSADFIDLSRAPGSPAASALVDAVVDLAWPFVDRKRPLGEQGKATFKSQMGAIVAGLLRAALKGRAVSAQKRPGGFMWTGALFGHRAFWSKVDALNAAGLVASMRGVTTNRWSADDPLYGGLPTRLWATDALLSMAAQHGLSQETLSSDWPVSRAAETRKIALRRNDLIVCRVLGGDDRVSLDASGRSAVAAMAERLARVNALIADADIHGCAAVALRRLFRHDLRLGGRLYAVGGSCYQRMNEAERSGIHIDGESVVEIDVSGSALTVLLGLCGATDRLPDDLYAIDPAVPREAVKAWFTQSIGSGKPATQWSSRASPDAQAFKPSDIRAAMLSAYPALDRRWPSLLPADLIASLPANKIDWAVGQYVTFVEGAIMETAVTRLAQDGIVCLPVFDSLIVQRTDAETAKHVLTTAFKERLGLTPQMH